LAGLLDLLVLHGGSLWRKGNQRRCSR
jgi:hypothetical protein